nr:retinal guanylyl cyclase 2 [Hymenolepis microstoma]
MNENESCKQLMRKLEMLSSDSDSQATKSILKLIQKLQSLIPEFVIPGDLELIKQYASLPKGTKRKPRSSRQSNRSSALSKKSKRRKLSDSRVFSSIGTTVSEMHTIPEEVSSPSANQELNATYVRPSPNDSRSTSKRVDFGESTLLANTAKSFNLTPPPLKEKTFAVPSDDIQLPPPIKKGRFQSSHSQNNTTESMSKLSLKNSPIESASQRKSVDLETLSSNSGNTHVRSASKHENKSLPKVSNVSGVQRSSRQENCSLSKSVKTDNQVVAELVSQSQNGSLGNLSEMDNRNVTNSVLQKPSGPLRELSKDDKSSHVETSFQRECGFMEDSSKKSKSLKSPETNAEILISATNATLHTLEVDTEQLKGAINQEVAISEIMTEDEEEGGTVQRQEVPAEIPLEVPAISPVDVPSQGEAAATSSILHSTPWSASKSNWLSRLGWMTASKVTPPTPVTAQATARKTLFQPQPSKVVGKIKNVLAANNTCANVMAPKTNSSFVGGMKSSKPNFSLGSAQRPPTMSRFHNNLPGTVKTNCPTIPEKSFGGGTVVHVASTASHGSTATTTVGRLGKAGPSMLSAKEQAEQERRERLLAEMAEKEERQREAQERKALEHKARVKAANERRAAVRANAEALAKKQEAEKLKKLMAAKEKPLFNPLKPTIHSTAAPSTSQLVKQPFGNNSANLPAAATLSSHTGALNPTNSTNYMKNFDFVKVLTHPPVPHATQFNQLKTQPPVTSETPISYDLTGILDEYASDSEDETRATKRPIPSWARSDSPFLIEMISKAYRGELRWQNIFRPAEQVHFDDADLFHGYKFRTRRRGSSAVWVSPSKQPHQQHSGTSKSSRKSSTPT